MSCSLEFVTQILEFHKFFHDFLMHIKIHECSEEMLNMNYFPQGCFGVSLNMECYVMSL